MRPTPILTKLLPTIDLTSALGYASQLGGLSLRQAIAEDFAQHYGPTIDPRTVLITAGAQQALYVITRALIRPGDAIAIEQPSYYYLNP